MSDQKDAVLSAPHAILLDAPALLEFRGPDAVRYLNGQLTQDVRLVIGTRITLPSCVTDAKGRLQFRVWVTESPGGALWVEGPPGTAETLEARLTRYLIADDAEAADLTGKWRLIHLLGEAPAPPDGVFARKCRRFGVEGADWWFPEGAELELPAGYTHLCGDELEDFRIRQGVPAWGHELTEGLLPPEAGLDTTDISYQKGCYIGQEVISRIKFAGKLNQRMTQLSIDASLPPGDLILMDPSGREAGKVTSVSTLVRDGTRAALAFVRRGCESYAIRSR